MSIYNHMIASETDFVFHILSDILVGVLAASRCVIVVCRKRKPCECLSDRIVCPGTGPSSQSIAKQNQILDLPLAQTYTAAPVSLAGKHTHIRCAHIYIDAQRICRPTSEPTNSFEIRLYKIHVNTCKRGPGRDARPETIQQSTFTGAG